MRVHFIALSLLACSLLSQGQVDSLISESYQNLPLQAVIDDLAQQYDFDVYYQTDWLRGLSVSVVLENKSALEALNQVLAGTSLRVEPLIGNVFVLLNNDQRVNRDYQVTITGRIVDGNTGEPIPNALIQIPELEKGTVTDLNGKYLLDIPAGTYLLTAKTVNSSLSREVHQFYEDTTLDIDLFDRIVELDDVVISGRAEDENIRQINTGKVTLSVERIRKLPSLLGEPDVSRIILSLPGVQTVGEGATGFNVRGGNIDQNLILMDGVPLYNSSHLLGFFSVFNPDMVRNFSVYKGNIPAEYGGRLSSVVAVDLQNPNVNEFSLRGGLGPVANKLQMNVPIVKKKLAITLSGRYSDPTWILRTVNDPVVNQSSANFYDINTKVRYQPGINDAITLGGYVSSDFYDFGRDTAFTYQSTNVYLEWAHQFNEKFYGRIKGYTSQYEALLLDDSENNGFDLKDGVLATGLRLNFGVNDDKGNLKYQFGSEWKMTNFILGSITPDDDSQVSANDIGNKRSMELSFFADRSISLLNRLDMVLGLRYSNFFLQEKNQFLYQPGIPRTEFTIIDTLSADNYQKLYHQPEPRVAINYRLTDLASIKGSISRSVQYEHLFSNSTASLPTDVWLPSSPNLAPAIAWQYALGYFKNFGTNDWEASLEFYYKDFEQLNIPMVGTDVLINPVLESAIVQAQGESYGGEFLLRRPRGNINGWFSYTYSRTRLQTSNFFREEQINNGDLFFADFDRPHNLNLALNFELSRLWTLSGNFVFNSGRPITLPNSAYLINGVRIFNVQDINNVRTPDTHRMDLSVTLEGSNKRDRRWKNSFTFSIYNVYGRENPFSIVTQAVNNRSPRTFKLTVFGNPIPSFTYNFWFK